MSMRSYMNPIKNRFSNRFGQPHVYSTTILHVHRGSSRPTRTKWKRQSVVSGPGPEMPPDDRSYSVLQRVVPSRPYFYQHSAGMSSMDPAAQGVLYLYEGGTSAGLPPRPGLQHRPLWHHVVFHAERGEMRSSSPARCPHSPDWTTLGARLASKERYVRLS